MTSDHEIESLEKIAGYIHRTETFGAVDGPGIRYIFFMQGCPLRCLYCHNPDAIARENGAVWTAGQVVDEVLRYRSFLKEGGVTFSGGEPLLQPEFIAAACSLLHRKGIHTALDTSGCMSPSIPAVSEAIDIADMLLLDIKAADEEMARSISGSSNKTALATLDYCEATHKTVWLRHVLLPGYTLDELELEKLAELIKGYRCIERVELLPFHKLGETKWQDLDYNYELTDVPAVTREQTENARNLLRGHGLPV